MFSSVLVEVVAAVLVLEEPVVEVVILSLRRSVVTVPVAEVPAPCNKI